MDRIRVSSGSQYEKPIGFSRAIRIGNRISVAGTAPIADDGSPAHPGDVYNQTRRCLHIIETAIKEAGGALENVIRTRVYLKNADSWEMAAKAHGEFFSEIRPACTFVEVSRFIDPEWMVEIEAECQIE